MRHGLYTTRHFKRQAHEPKKKKKKENENNNCKTHLTNHHPGRVNLTDMVMVKSFWFLALAAIAASGMPLSGSSKGVDHGALAPDSSSMVELDSKRSGVTLNDCFFFGNPKTCGECSGRKSLKGYDCAWCVDKYNNGICKKSPDHCPKNTKYFVSTGEKKKKNDDRQSISTCGELVSIYICTNTPTN